MYEKIRTFLFFISVLSLSLTISACNNKTTIKVPNSLKVDTSEMTLTIKKGETIDYSKLKFYLVYSDSEVEITLNDVTIDSSLVDTNQVGSYPVKVRYGNLDGFTFTVVVTEAEPIVEAKVLESIIVSGAKDNFLIGEEFSSEGLKVTATYSDKTTKEVSGFTVDSTLYKKDQANEYVITVSYKEGEVTKTITYKVNVVDKIESLGLNLDNVKVTYVKGENLDLTGIVYTLTLKDETTKVIDNPTVKITYNEAEVTSLSETGNYTVTISYYGHEASFNIEVTNEGGFYNVSSVEEFLEMREYVSIDNKNDRKWKLTQDLDFTGVTIPELSSSLVFSGVFDGDGHKLSNITFNAESAKVSPIFQNINGGEVKNLIIFGAYASSASESIGIISGTTTNGTFSNIEFSCTTIVSTSTSGYTGLIAARNAAVGNITVNNITVKNLTTITGVKYVGGLFGDLTSKSTITFNNLDLDMTLSGGSQIAMLVGRARKDSVVTVENAILRFEIGKYQSATSKVAVLVDGSDTAKLNAKGVVVAKASDLNSSTKSDLFVGEGKITDVTLTDCYYVAGIATTKGEAKEASELNKAFFESIGFDFVNTFEEDSSTIIKLKGVSSNTPGESATISRLEIITSNVKTQYFKGGEFSSDGLIVIGVYSDGVVTALSSDKYTVTVKDSSDATVEAFAQAAVGEYKVEIKSGDATKTYTLNIVEETGITVLANEAKVAYKEGDALDTTGLVVFANISDGTKSLLTSGYTVTVLDSEEKEVDAKSLAKGEYTVKVTREGLTPITYTIVVKEAIESAAVVSVYVTTADVANITAFTSIKSALDYLKSLDLSDETIKEIIIKDAKTYNEYFTVDIPNLRIVNDSDGEVVINCNHASDTKVLNESKTYGTEGSATVTIKSSAVGFYAYKIIFKNTFDYYNSSFANKQALAVFCQADKAKFDSCKFYGVQDTLECKEGRQYYVNCYIEGSVDFIFGNNAEVLFDGCTIHSLTRYKSDKSIDSNQGYIVATKGFSSGADTDAIARGFIFNNCKFESDSDTPAGSVAIARPWGAYSQVTVENSTIGVHISKAGYDGVTKPTRYTDMSGNLPTAETVKYYEYNNTGDGAITTSVDGMSMLGGAIKDIFSKTNGKKEWDSAWTTYNQESYYVLVGFKAEYNMLDEYQEFSVVKVTGSKAEVINATVEFKDKDDNVVLENALTSVGGEYKVKVTDGEAIVFEGKIEVKEVKITEHKYILNASELEATTIADADLVNGQFTIIAGTDKHPVIDTNDKKFGDLVFSKRIKLGGSGSTTKLAVKVVTEYNKATIKVYVISGSSKESREVVITDGTNEIKREAVGGDKVYLVEANVNAAGTYYIYGAAAINIYYIEVVDYEIKAEQTQKVTYTLNASDMTAGDITAETTVGEFFTFIATADKKFTVDSSTKTCGENSITQRIKFNGKSSATDRLIKFTTKGKATIKVYAMSSSSNDATRTIDVCTLSEGTLTALSSQVVPASGNTITEVTLEVSEAGEYYLAALVNAINIYYIEVVVDEVVE